MRKIKFGTKKGQELPESIGMTLIFLLVLVGLVMISFLIYLKFSFANILSGDPAAYSVNFVSIASKPFLLAEVLSHMSIVDRQILEHAIEMMATGSEENSNSVGINGGLRVLIQPYEFRYYRIGIETTEGAVFQTDNIETRCGDDNKGWCTAKSIGCDVGYVEVVDPKGICTSSVFSYIIPTIPSRVCCTQNLNEYRNKGNDRGSYDVISCSNNRGVCSQGEKYWLQTPTRCGEGQISLGRTDECKNTNSGKTPFCCAEKTDELEVEMGVTTQAVVPLLYKDKIGNLEVEARSGTV